MQPGDGRAPAPEGVAVVVSGPIRKAVARTLRSAAATSSPEGQVALALAARLDDPGTADSAVGQITRELRELLAMVRERKPKEVSPLDEIRSRREKRFRRAAS